MRIIFIIEVLDVLDVEGRGVRLGGHDKMIIRIMAEMCMNIILKLWELWSRIFLLTGFNHHLDVQIFHFGELGHRHLQCRVMVMVGSSWHPALEDLLQGSSLHLLLVLENVTFMPMHLQEGSEDGLLHEGLCSGMIAHLNAANDLLLDNGIVLLSKLFGIETLV